MNNKLSYFYHERIKSKQPEELRNKINKILCGELGERSLKKYDMINVLIKTGTDHVDEVVDNLPFAQDVKDYLKDKLLNDNTDQKKE